MSLTIATIDPRRSTAETIRHDHRSIAQVLDLLRHLLTRVSAGHCEPDFQLIGLALHYLDDFPRRLHHPREDRYLFSAIRRSTAELDAVIQALEGEHVSAERDLLELDRLFVRYQAGVPGALADFRDALERYACALYGHMQAEESLLVDQRVRVPDAEWAAIARAFAQDGDPLFGPEPQRDFALLRHRIECALPAKMRRARREFART